MAVPENTREIVPERASDGFAFFSYGIGDDVRPLLTLQQRKRHMYVPEVGL